MRRSISTWEETTIGERCKVIAGQSPQGKFYNNTGAGLPFYQGKKEFGDRFIGAPKKWTSHTTKEATADDILMSVRAPVGPINFSTQRICIGRGLAAIRASASIDKDFLFYALLSKQDEISGNEGAVFASINKAQIESIELLLPPLPEQKRIVAILDEAFAGISLAVANAEKNLANARELFESYLNNVFTQKGEGWKNLKLKDICTKITDGVHKKPHYVDEGIPFIKINNLTAGSGISFQGVSYISKEDHELFCKRTNPEKGDILITKDGTIGIVRIIDTDVEFSIFVSVALVKPIDKSISSYLKYVLESHLIQSQINPQGAALKHLYLRDLREYSVPVPPQLVQKKIVEQLDSFSAESFRLESIYQQKLTALTELKQSLLQKAFAGELTRDN